jgi:hypothetical protein
MVRKLKFMQFLLILVLIMACNQADYKPPSVDEIIEQELIGEDRDQRVQEIRDNDEELRKLTRNYTAVPSVWEAKERINEITSPPKPECIPDSVHRDEVIEEATSGEDGVNEVVPPITVEEIITPDPVEPIPLHPAAKGARKLLASFYQSCKAIDKPIADGQGELKGVIMGDSIDGQSGLQGGKIRKITNLDSFVESHVVLRELKSDANYPGPQCRDATKHPPLFAYASRKYPNRTTGEFKIFSKGGGITRSSPPASGIDCSSFVSVAMASQGLKMSKDQAGFRDMTTRSLKAQAAKADSCLSNAKVSPSNPLKAGDILNVATTHTVIIDSVGKDPLGIDKYAAADNCNGISPKDFNFTYVHSGAIRNSYGPSRVKANYHRSGVMWNNLAVMAKRLCHEKKAGNVGTRDSRFSGMNSNFGLLRHKSEDPECVSDKKYQIEGQKCIEGCENTEKDFQDV